MKERVASGCSAVSAGATMTPHLIPLISAFIKSPRGDVESAREKRVDDDGRGGERARV